MASRHSSGTRHGNGAGWGGPAKGMPYSAPKHPNFEIGNTASAGSTTETRAENKARHLLQAETVLQRMYENSLTTENISWATAAGKEYFVQVLGMPVQRVVTLEADSIAEMTDDALANLLKDTDRKINALTIRDAQEVDGE